MPFIRPCDSPSRGRRVQFLPRAQRRRDVIDEAPPLRAARPPVTRTDKLAAGGLPFFDSPELAGQRRSDGRAPRLDDSFDGLDLGAALALRRRVGEIAAVGRPPV